MFNRFLNSISNFITNNAEESSSRSSSQRSSQRSSRSRSRSSQIPQQIRSSRSRSSQIPQQIPQQIRSSRPRSSQQNQLAQTNSTRAQKTHKTKRITVKQRQQEAAVKIQHLMKRQKIPAARAKFLNTICSDSGVCISFGKKTNMIKKHFNGFADFSYLTNMKRIGEESKNGFVIEFTYTREGYEANAILKSSIEMDSDNLFYEYLVGQYVNKLNLLYPCFLETYGWYKYESFDSWKDFKGLRRFHGAYRRNYIIPQSDTITDKSFETSCKESNYLSVLIQHVKEAKTLNSMLEYREFIDNHLLYVLYQIYMPLAMTADTFTHYDLHSNNVLLYEPVKGKYIEYHYHIDNHTEITFKCCYIAKIIDYGRSYFVDNDNQNKSTNSSLNIYKKICKAKGCNTKNSDCGYEYGYATLEPESSPGSFYFISSTQRNMSHDLQLLFSIRNRYIYKIKEKRLYTIIKNVQYGLKDTNNDKDVFDNASDRRKGTIENTDTGLRSNKINNVIDAYTALSAIVSDNDSKESNDIYFENKEKLGDLHIYTDGTPMEYIEYTE